MNGAVERDLARARDELAKLGRTLPGNDDAEIARYVAERKRNWPGRRARPAITAITGVDKANADADADAVSALVSGYDDMCDSGSGSEGEIRQGLERQPLTTAYNKPQPRNNNAPLRRPMEKVNTNRSRRARKRNTVLGAMLQKSIQKERFLLLEAFKHFIN